MHAPRHGVRDAAGVKYLAGRTVAMDDGVVGRGATRTIRADRSLLGFRGRQADDLADYVHAALQQGARQVGN